MDWQTLKAQVKAQIDRDFPIRQKIQMTPLHKDVVLLVSTAPRPMRFKQISSILCGEIPNAPGWVDRVCELAEVLNQLRDAEVLNVSAIGWTKTNKKETPDV